MNYLNAVLLGGNNLYTWAGERLAARFIYHWLTKVVGWTDFDKSGANWDKTPLMNDVDGATHATDAELFSSASANFSTLTPVSARYYLTITGFSDSERDGLYLIRDIIDANTVRIDRRISGTHSDGFLLGESGLTFRVDNWYLSDAANTPANGNYFVLEGTGVGGPFHMFCRIDANYSKWRISPYDDWDNVAHAWKAGARVTTEVQNNIGSDPTSVIVFGCADLSHAVIYYRLYTGTGANSGTGYWQTVVLYIGDITPFRPLHDLNPVVLFKNHGVNAVDFIGVRGCNMLDVTDAPATATILNQSLTANSATYFTDNVLKISSSFSDLQYRTPLIVANYVTGPSYQVEVRGTLKSAQGAHLYGAPLRCFPFGGSARDYFRLQYCSIPWNGSRQYRLIP